MTLRVTSHVARDLLQSAALFRHVHQVVWEYVSNGLQYVDPGVAALVKVTLSRDAIVIEDNGRGMGRDDLARYFTMHAENDDRRRGQPGRGMFGTGKSAAFAIARRLHITTVHAHRCNVVELLHADLESANDGAPVPVREIETDVRTSAGNSTVIRIDQFKRGVRPDTDDVRRELERHLKHWRGVQVELDGVLVEPSRPSHQRIVEFHGGPESPWLGGVTLRLYVAQAPLAPSRRGVAILANDVLHETTLAGAEGKEFANYIFGEIDVPALSMPIDGIDAYDMSRSGKLNAQNPAVAATLAFVGRHVEACRKELVQASKERQKQEEARRLQRQADDIARLINNDYADFARKLKPTNANTAGAVDSRPALTETATGEPAFLSGDEAPARTTDQVEATTMPDGPELDRVRNPDPDGPSPAVEPATEPEQNATGKDAPSEPKAARKSGGFSVRYDHSGTDNYRCTYDGPARTLIINLDHPQVAAAKGARSVEEPGFVRLSYEIAFSEYALALASELVAENYFIDMGSPLFEIRARVDSLCRSAADAFAAPT